jgi:adenylate cyclase
MAHEIERKFLVRSDGWRDSAGQGACIRQAYLVLNGSVSIRIRIKDGDRATLTIKSLPAELRRREFEYEVPIEDGNALLALRVGAIIEKTRYQVPCGDLIWEIDVFQGDNEGLVVAEVELEHDEQAFDRPRWLGEEITGNERYYNASLAMRSFRCW